MAARRGLVHSGLFLAGLALATLWPISAYAAGPMVLPGLLLLAAAGFLVARRPEYGVAIALALAPWTNLNLGEQGRPLRLVIPALAIGMVAYGAIVSSREATGRRPLAGAVALFVAASLAASGQALEPSASLTKLGGLITAAALFFAVLLICRDRGQLLVVAAGAVAGLFLASGQGMVQQALGQFSELGFVADGEIVQRVQGSFGHPNQYAGFLAVLMPLAATMLVTRAVPTRMRWLAGAALALAMPALVLSYTRGALLGLVLGSLVWLAFVKPRAAVAVALSVGLVGAALAPGLLKERFVNESNSGDVSIRADLWGSALDIYTQRPLLGVGLNNFENGYAQLPATLANASQRRLLHQGQVLTPPHAANLYLNILAEEGLLGILAFAFFSFVAVTTTYRGCRVRDPAGRAVCLGLGAGLMTLALHSFLEVTLFSEVSMPLFALLGVAATYVALEREAPPEREPVVTSGPAA